MSRRTKLLITAIFPALLGIPSLYVVLTWHPPNPLRFRLLEGKIIRDPDGKNSRVTVLMEVRNTSLAAVQFIWGTLTAESSEGEVIFQATITDYIPPGGTIQMETPSVDYLSAPDLKRWQPGEFHVKEGSVQYEWSSRSQTWAGTACDWSRQRLPESLARFAPDLDPFEDVIDVEITPPPSNIHESKIPNSTIINR